MPLQYTPLNDVESYLDLSCLPGRISCEISVAREHILTNFIDTKCIRVIEIGICLLFHEWKHWINYDIEAIFLRSHCFQFHSSTRSSAIII